MSKKKSFQERLIAASDTASGQVVALPSAGVEPAEWGRRLDAQQINKDYYGGHMSAEWVRENVPYSARVGYRTILWWEFDVKVHIAEERRRAADGTMPPTRAARRGSRPQRISYVRKNREGREAPVDGGAAPEAPHE
jgi:hypothetical protein